MNEHDRTVLRVTEGKVRVKRDGVSLDMKRFEAVAMKQIETALGGSPHAQRAVLAAHERASKLRDAENAASCELWTNFLAANDKAAVRAMAAGRSTAAILPKRCDVLFDGPDGVRLIGPYDAESAKAYDGVVRLRDAFYCQQMMEDACDGIGCLNRPSMGTGLILAMFCNKILPPSLQLSDADELQRVSDLLSLSQRELLKITHAAWRHAGMPLARGRRLSEWSIMEPTLDIVFEYNKVLRHVDLDGAEAADAELTFVARMQMEIAPLRRRRSVSNSVTADAS